MFGLFKAVSKVAKAVRPVSRGAGQAARGVKGTYAVKSFAKAGRAAAQKGKK